MRSPRALLATLFGAGLSATMFACTHATQTAAGPAAVPAECPGAVQRAVASAGEGRSGEGRAGGIGGAEGRAGAPGGGRGGPGVPRQRRVPNWELQDSIRKATVADFRQQIAGREELPAGKVFQNVRLLKNMPAGQFLTMMDETYGRGLGYVCSNCHVDQQFDADTKKGKIIAREMQTMTDGLNKQYLSKMKELDDDYEHATCVSCHKSDEKVHNKMAQPVNPPATPPGR